jgi:hypothetical protein
VEVSIVAKSNKNTCYRAARAARSNEPFTTWTHYYYGRGTSIPVTDIFDKIFIESRGVRA